MSYIRILCCVLQAYLREGVALQNLGQHGEALAAFGAGLAQDANNTNLITGLIDAALKSPLKGIQLLENVVVRALWMVDISSGR
jgi:hypothetical protein